MARREWARKLIDKQPMARGGDSVDGNAAIKLLQAEHARAVRVVKRAKRLELHGLRDTDTNEFLEGYEAACNDILAAIQKDGRAWAYKDHKRTWRMKADSKLGLAVEVLTISEQEGGNV